jgi:hypothetical protein
MSPPTNPAALIRTFLNGVRPNATGLPDPFSDDFTCLGECGNRLPVRVRGLLAQHTEQEREMARAFASQRGALTQEFISRRTFNTTAYDASLRKLYRQEGAERSRLRELWYYELSKEAQAAFDDLCVTLAASIVESSFPPPLPPCLRGPLARLALEYATIVRRADAERQESEQRLANQGQRNPGVVESVLCGVANVEEEDTSRLIGRWFRELTPEQQAAFAAPALVLPLAETPTQTGTSQRRERGTNGGKAHKAKGKTGPKGPRTDPKEDERIFSAWKSGHHKDYEDLARELNMKRLDVARAIDRHEKRIKPKE